MTCIEEVIDKLAGDGELKISSEENKFHLKTLLVKELIGPVSAYCHQRHDDLVNSREVEDTPPIAIIDPVEAIKLLMAQYFKHMYLAPDHRDGTGLPATSFYHGAFVRKSTYLRYPMVRTPNGVLPAFCLGRLTDKYGDSVALPVTFFTKVILWFTIIAD